MSEHGTYTRYNAGCRCAACTNASRIYKNRRNRERRAYVAQHGLPSSISHGASAYMNWGCRCETCTTEHSAACLRRYHARKARQSTT